jgi:tetratricopeptide (TPR) repeat protein
LAIALHLLADAWDADAPALVEQFTKLLRLQLTYPEYVQLCERDEDFRHFLAGGLGERLPAAVARFLATARVTAQDFYRGMRLRVEALIEGAAEKMHRERARRGALTLAVHFAELGEELLRQRGVSFVKVTPHDVAITSLLEGAGEFLGEEHRERKLEQLFAGEPIRTEVEMLLSQDDGESREACAKDWATAAQAYGAQYELKRDRAAREKAAECLDHAFALAPDLAQSLWLKGTLLRLEHDAKGALEWFERALSKDARNGNCWAAKGDSLQALNRTRAAHNCYVRALQLSPGAGELWTALGLFFYNTGRRRAACYCFFKGKELGSESASQNFRMVCHHQPSFWDCPFRLWPSISKLMRNFILPLRYGWDDIRSITGTVAGLIGTLSAAAYGAFLGFHTAGFVGSIAGFFTLLLAALILVAGIFLNAAELSARPHWGRSAIARILLSLICAVAGRYLAIQISGSRWQPLLSLALMLALAGISGFIYLIVSAEPDSVRAKS